MQKWVYSFGAGHAAGRAEMRDVLGGKGANLAEMCHLGLPVPPGFTISTAVCRSYTEVSNSVIPEDVKEQVLVGLARMEKEVGARFGDPEAPLLVSVRSGARASMPGMMDTVLNLGLNDQTVQGLARQSADPRFAYDSYRRFIQMYADIVLQLDIAPFEDTIEAVKHTAGIERDTDMSAEEWQHVVDQFKILVETQSGSAFPQDPNTQLWGAIRAVFSSWMGRRAVTYRQLHSIPDSWGTAVTVQAMVFGNMGQDCCTGVAFTRDPNTGENCFFGEFLLNAQGEDVVAGLRTPLPINAQSRQQSDDMTLEQAMPSIYDQLVTIYQTLEHHYRDMQDIEFTVQRGTLYILQTRSGKRTTRAGLKMAVDMCREGLISREQALMRVDPESLEQVMHPTIDPQADLTVLTYGLPASPGVASGYVVFDADTAQYQASQGQGVILVRIETSPEDIHGMYAAKGILTARGGMTSHAAVVARGMGKPCVSGAAAVKINLHCKTLSIGSVCFGEGDILSIDGSTGHVIAGSVPTIQPDPGSAFSELMHWADTIRRLKVRANAETPRDVDMACHYGAEGIGLCRTEHMFFHPDRIQSVRQMILASDQDKRSQALSDLLPMQRGDFQNIFIAMGDLPVTIRLLDPPLHEFLPQTEEDISHIALSLDMDDALLRHRIAQVKEHNPMLGHRGCRLGITFPDIYEMQVRAILEAALNATQQLNVAVTPEIMVPLVMTKPELGTLKEMIDKTAESVFAAMDHRIPYTVGTMIELPRAALQADKIAESASFFSFGTNDLTQTTYGISRDDSASFLKDYQTQGLMPSDPFVSLDQDGVGELMTLATTRGRTVRPDLKIGVCGEHGGDPASIKFCESLNLDYVSCSPFRIPIARLAAAQAFLSRQGMIDA